MLVLSRELGQEINIGDDIVITVLEILAGKVTLRVSGAVSLRETLAVDTELKITNDIKLTVVATHAHALKARIGIDAPKTIPVHRSEVYDLIKRQNRGVVTTGAKLKKRSPKRPAAAALSNPLKAIRIMAARRKHPRL